MTDALIVVCAVAAVPIGVGAWNGLGILIRRRTQRRFVRQVRRHAR